MRTYRWRCFLCGGTGTGTSAEHAAHTYTVHYRNHHQPTSRYGTHGEEPPA